MTARDRLILALFAAVVHVAILAPLADGRSSIVGPVFQPQAEAILDGALPYTERGFEYPPLALPAILAPAAVADDVDGYVKAFSWEMIGVDVVIVALLALAVRASPARIVSALICYSAAIFVLSGVLAPDSDVDASLPLARFDLIPAAFVLAAALAREVGRSATWSAFLSLAVAVKAYPALLYPTFVRNEPRPRRVVLAAITTLAVAAAVVFVMGDRFSSAITYHSGRDLQIEAVAATPLLVSDLLGAPVVVAFGAGSFNLAGPGPDTARAVSLAFLALTYLLVVWLVWRSGARPLRAAAAVLAVVIVFAPVLSPQFLLWLVPISAAAFGLTTPNLVLLAAIVLTQVELSEYDRVYDLISLQVSDLSAAFILPLAFRNALLVAYLILVLMPMLRAIRRSAYPSDRLREMRSTPRCSP